jgi:phosphotriesterase-related protein
MEPMNQQHQLMTVLGPVTPEAIGITLPHEHLLVDFSDPEARNHQHYDVDHALKIILPFMEEVKTRGLQTFVDCTPAYLGRDPRLIKKLAELTGLNIIMSTGYYGARFGYFLPSHAYRESAAELADRWIKEWEEGIDQTGVRPGFIKIGVNPTPTLSEMDKKLVQAAALTHRRTGLTIASHTGVAPVFEELEILRQEGVDPEAFIWVHANHEADTRRHLAVAQLGAWVEFDGVNRQVQDDIARLKNMKEHNLLHRVLLSHDKGWYEPGNPKKEFQGYCDVFDYLLPALRDQGFSEKEIDQLLIHNPARAYSVYTRLLSKSTKET